jgi:hypothetical protein
LDFTPIDVRNTAEIERGMIRLWSESPQEMEIDEHFAQLEGIVDTFRPQRVLIDSMSSYTGTVTSKEEFRDFFLTEYEDASPEIEATDAIPERLLKRAADVRRPLPG